jgi:flagella basal body P-ring formation protein FlgA
MIRKPFRLLLAGILILPLGSVFSAPLDPIEVRIGQEMRRLAERVWIGDSLGVEVSIPTWLKADSLRSSDSNLVLDWKGEPEDLIGRVLVPFRIVLSPKKTLKAHAGVWIRVFDHVFIADRLLNRRKIVIEEDFHSATREVTSFRGNHISDPGDLVGKRLKRVVARGRIITRDMVEEPPVVQRGDRVQVSLEKGRLHMDLTGVAKQDGWIGDRIRVRNMESRTEFSCLVKGRGAVEILM